MSDFRRERVNQGGEPGHDDYGLPRVDIQVPDDARELYRDVQAYHRELRALRRHERSRRWRAPLRRSGMIVPVIAGCLVLAMIAGMVLTMFSANPYFAGIAGQAPASPGPAKTGPATGPAGTSVPSGTSSPTSESRSALGPTPGEPGRPANVLPRGKAISVAGRRVALSRLKGTVLAIIPPRCRCAEVIKRLLAQAMSAGVTVYLVGMRGSLIELTGLAPASTRRTAKLAIDADNALNSTYQPSGLMLLLVDLHGQVTEASMPRPDVPIEAKLKSLKQTR